METSGLADRNREIYGRYLAYVLRIIIPKDASVNNALRIREME
ncbi:hypothetical protein [uncultured Methanomethylovorans sp.]|nr:hypothetical protein [uncultured Methanomethylovorans sp.]